MGDEWHDSRHTDAYRPCGRTTRASPADVAAERARELAARYGLAVGVNPSVAHRIDALKLLGWRVLVDRRWSGSRRATIDAILVGPGGVVVLDVKDWQDVAVSGGSVFGSRECRDVEAASVRSLTDHVQDALEPFGVTRLALRSVLVVTGGRLDLRAQNVHLVGEDDLAVWIASLRLRLEESEIDRLATVLEREFPAYDAPRPLAGRVSQDLIPAGVPACWRCRAAAGTAPRSRPHCSARPRRRRFAAG